MTLKIATIKIQNLKNITLADVEIDKDFNIVAGNNGAGKSTLIEGIFMGIVGKRLMGKVPQELIKDGEKEAVIDVKLSDSDKTINITRKITEKEVYLKAVDQNGQPLLQRDLDALISEFTIDPLHFTTLSIKEQVDFVKRIMGIDTSEIDQKYQALYDERTYINRNVDEQATLLRNAGNIEKVDKKDIAKLVQQRQDIINYNAEIKKYDETLQGLEQKKAGLQSGITNKQNKIESLEKMIADLKNEIATDNQSIMDIDVEIETMKQQPKQEPKSTAEIDKEIAEIEAHNAKYVRYEKYMEMKKTYDGRVEKQDDIQAKMDELQQQKTDMITNAQLPIPNLIFDETLGLVIDGVPFKQKSSAEQLRISTQLAIAVKQGIHVIYIKDGSLLDKNTLEMFKQMAQQNDYMLLIEVVGEDAPDGSIVMRAGHATKS